MKYNPEIHHRRSIRLKGYDYSQDGEYFVTVCTQNRECLFGKVVNGEMRLTDAGRIVQTVWVELPNHYPHIELGAWIVMPNHIHGIVVLDSLRTGGVGTDDGSGIVVGAGFKPAPTTTRHGLPEIVRALKSFSARRINELHGNPGVKLWQRNYWEHIIRNEPELNRIREYIQNNPVQWALDKLHPGNPAWNVGAGFKPAPTTEIREPSAMYGQPTGVSNNEVWMI